MLAAAAGHAQAIQCLLRNWEVDLNAADKVHNRAQFRYIAHPDDIR